jgi:hypothetical protein
VTPSAFLASLRNTESELCRIATLCDYAETKAGRGPKADIPPRDYQRIADEVSLALETIALTGRRV